MPGHVNRTTNCESPRIYLCDFSHGVKTRELLIFSEIIWGSKVITIISVVYCCMHHQNSGMLCQLRLQKFVKFAHRMIPFVC